MVVGEVRSIRERATEEAYPPSRGHIDRRERTLGDTAATVGDDLSREEIPDLLQI
jgi:hypothetical protein